MAFISKSLFSKIQNRPFLKRSLAFFSYKLLATLNCCSNTWRRPCLRRCSELCTKRSPIMVELPSLPAMRHQDDTQDSDSASVLDSTGLNTSLQNLSVSYYKLRKNCPLAAVVVVSKKCQPQNFNVLFTLCRLRNLFILI